MEKFFIVIVTLALSWMLFTDKAGTVWADWWQRPEVRPTQPSIPRDIEPTSHPAPTEAPKGGAAPTNPPVGDGGSGGGGIGSPEDPCAPGKSFAGPYCGWSPSTQSGGGGGGTVEQPKVGTPQVLGLSDTSGSETTVSDIMILAGVLCLALYARSKVTENPL